MRRWITLAGVLWASGALAQPVSQTNVTGNECWSAGQGPGGPSAYLCLNQVRNGQAINVFSGSGAQTTTATQANGLLMWSGAAPSSWAITLPNPAFDGELIEVSTDTTLTTMVTVTAGTSPQNQTLAAAFSNQTVTAGTSIEWRFSFTNLKWYRVR